MRDFSAVLVAAALVCKALIGGGAQAAVGAEALRDALNAPEAAVADVALETGRLMRLYQVRDFAPIWLDGDGLHARGRVALGVLTRSLDHGLDPEMYLVPEIQSRWVTRGEPAQIELELLLSAGLMRYVSHVAHGRLEPKEADPELFVYPDPPDPVGVVTELLAAADLSAALAALAPQHRQYELLRRALARFFNLADAGDWPKVPDGAALKRGQSGPRVAALRRRLAASGDLPGNAVASDAFDAELETTVMAFQAALGLDADGIVGPRTLAALNRSIRDRVRQLMVNLERWRWLPADLGDRYVFINAAAFELEAVRDGERRLTMPVIVGRAYRRTPIFSSRITHMVANPDWTVPIRLARQDVLPKIKADPAYLMREGFQVFDGWSADAGEVDPDAVDWAALSGRTFGYKLRQLPGPNNALGQIKFLLPNPYNVYLHDTPNRELFARAERSFSSGCVRLGRPIDLADDLLHGSPDWDRSRVEGLIATGRMQRVNLPAPVPVHFAYFTAFVDDDGDLHFRDDIYGRDAVLYLALRDQLVTARSELR